MVVTESSALSKTLTPPVSDAMFEVVLHISACVIQPPSPVKLAPLPTKAVAVKFPAASIDTLVVPFDYKSIVPLVSDTNFNPSLVSALILTVIR